MHDILTVASGVVLGEFIWAIILFVILYIAARVIVRNIKRKIANAGVIFSINGFGFLKGLRGERVVTGSHLKNFMRYSGNIAQRTFNRVTR